MLKRMVWECTRCPIMGEIVLRLGKHGWESEKTLIKKRRKLEQVYSKSKQENNSKYLEQTSCSTLGMVKEVSCTQSISWASLSIPSMVEYVCRPHPHTHCSWSSASLTYSQQIKPLIQCSRLSASPAHSWQTKPHVRRLEWLSTFAFYSQHTKPLAHYLQSSASCTYSW